MNALQDPTAAARATIGLGASGTAELWETAAPGELDQAAAQFDEVLLSMALKTMRQAQLDDPLLGGEAGLAGPMLDWLLPQQLAGASGLGIGELIERELAIEPTTVAERYQALQTDRPGPTAARLEVRA